MSVHLNAVKLVVTTAPAPMTKHDGAIVINHDCPVGTVLAYDREGNLYRCIDPSVAEFFVNKSKTQPTQHPTRSRHFRDYWRMIQSGGDTPYGASFRNAPCKVVEEVRR